MRLYHCNSTFQREGATAARIRSLSLSIKIGRGGGISNTQVQRRVSALRAEHTSTPEKWGRRTHMHLFFFSTFRSFFFSWNKRLNRTEIVIFSILQCSIRKRNGYEQIKIVINVIAIVVYFKAIAEEVCACARMCRCLNVMKTRSEAMARFETNKKAIQSSSRCVAVRGESPPASSLTLSPTP